MAKSYDIPGEIVELILSRLPAKYLMRFRCVCKSWFTLISGSKFIEKHLNHRPKKGYMLFERRHFSFGETFNQHMELEVPLPFEGRISNLVLYCGETFNHVMELEVPLSFGNFELVGYCNGLLCISESIFGTSPSIYLWNPAIRKFKTLPKLIWHGESCFKSTLPNLIWHGESCFKSNISFGFVPHLNDYKVVKFMYNGGFGLPPKVDVYSLSMNSWKRIQDVVPCWIDHGHSPILDGVVHWLANMANAECEFILSFDLADEVFGQIKLPEWCNSSSVTILDNVVVVLREKLSLVVKYGKGMDEHFDIWAMNEYGAENSWTKQFTFGYWGKFFTPVGSLNNGGVLLSGGAGLISYDPSLRKAKSLQISEGLQVFTSYEESLVLLNEGV